MDGINKSNVHNFLTRVVIQNVPGKSSTSKKSTFYPDGTLEISTIFEDSLNCQYYMEKKILTTLNEFRPAVGSVAPQKVEAFVAPDITSTPAPVPVFEEPKVESAAAIDLSCPTYQNGAWESLKLDILKLLTPIKVTNNILGHEFDLPVSVDWSSIPLSGADFSGVLRSIKNNIANLIKQILPGIQKVDEIRKPIIRDFLVSVVFQNVAGKASTLKRAFLSAEGSLVIVVPFEDSLNFIQPVQTVQPPAPVSTPAPAPVVIEPPKDKGRPEMEFKPTIEEFPTQFLVREIDHILSTMVVTDERDEPIGAPIYVDWKSVMVYPTQVKQNTVIRNVNLALFKLVREVVNSIKQACTDFVLRDTIKAYLRSVTFQNIPGVSTGSKKVVYEDGHLIVQTIFEDFGNCGLYFDSKVIQALGARPSAPPQKKPELITLIKEEVALKLNAHLNFKMGGKKATPQCPIEMDWSFLQAKGHEASIENNVIAVTNVLLSELFQSISSFTEPEIEIILKEIVKVVFIQATPGKTIFDKRSVVITDPGVLNITTTFEDRTDGVKTFKDRFTNAFKARLFKVEIRDRLVPQLKEMIDIAVKIQYKANFLDKIEVLPYQDYSSNVIFDWQLVEKEPLENQVKIYQSLVQNLETTRTFGHILDLSIRDICSYDVGKNAFLPTNQFILRNILRPKEGSIKFTSGNTWEFYTPFHTPGDFLFDHYTLTTLFKEKLNVAYPCAIQDTFPKLDHLVEELASATGKKVPIIMEYNSWRHFPKFASDITSYRQINQIAVEVPSVGLSCIKNLTKDKIVLKEYTTKVNQIVIFYDTNDKVEKFRTKDQAAIASLDKGVLTFRLNFCDGIKPTHAWNFQLEYVLGTRPLKVQRSIEGALSSLEKAASDLSGLIGKTVKVSVDYEGFIHHRNYLIELEEEVYTKIISSFAHLLNVGWTNSAESSDLSSYETVQKSIQSQVNSIKFKINVDNTQRDSYEFSLQSGGEFLVSINLINACKVETKDWRLELERVLNLRDLKIQEEIKKRIDLSKPQKQISSVIGSQINLVVDWESIIRNSDFAANKVDYITWLHDLGEDLPLQFSKSIGFGKLVEYSEVQQHIQSNLSTIKIVGTSGSDCLDVYYDKSSKTLEVEVGVKKVAKFIKDTQYDFEEYGRKVENAMNLRLMIVKGYIARNEPKDIEYTKSRIQEAVEVTAGFQFDWNSIIQHPEFNQIVDYFTTLKNILKLSAQLHPLVQLCKENFKAKEFLKSNVRNYTIVIDGDSRVDESEFADNKFGVDWAKVGWKSLPAKDHIVFTVNLSRVERDEPHEMGIQDKIESLVTPDAALERYERKMAKLEREQDRRREENFRREQLRNDERMLDESRERNRQLDRLNRKFR
eukprot:gene5977-7447_t